MSNEEPFADNNGAPSGKASSAKVPQRRRLLKRLSLGVLGLVGALVGEPGTAKAHYYLGCDLYYQNDPSRCAWANGYPKRFWTSGQGAVCVEVYRPGSNPTNCYDQLNNIVCSYAYIP